ncbi:hypothetical protein DL95DRAFT_408732 [Leptodontidium sp. 2 PMI_412]|nr:hypothetical protein DL95DRAFT_408732 [Leptodontidium sp. 2 PMI_412]
MIGGVGGVKGDIAVAVEVTILGLGLGHGAQRQESYEGDKRDLGQNFQAHSGLLKAHSAFFAKFLDSADKQSSSEKSIINSHFRYEWISKVDDDGKGWHLIAKPNPKEVEDRYYTYTGNKELQRGCFKHFLCAIYGKPYSLKYFKEFEILVSLGDYYRCLPILSQSINDIMVSKSTNAEFVSSCCCEVMVLAAKLRHKVLFTEALIYAAGLIEPCEIPEFEGMAQENIKKIARNARNALMAKIVVIQQLLDKAVHDEHYESRNKLRMSMNRNLTPFLPNHFWAIPWVMTLTPSWKPYSRAISVFAQISKPGMTTVSRYLMRIFFGIWKKQFGDRMSFTSKAATTHLQCRLDSADQILQGSLKKFPRSLEREPLASKF